MNTETIPQQPYLLRAMHEWMTDNGHTPYLIVDATEGGVQVPAEHVRDGKITLNVSYAAVRGLELGNDGVSFEARFSGQPFRVYVPVVAVRGIYARETGRGMIFSAENSNDLQDSDTAPASAGDAPASRRSHLKIVK